MTTEPDRNLEHRPEPGADPEDPFFARPKLGAIALWLALGAALIAASTWVGPVSFYWCFERPFLRRTVAIEGGAICRRPVAVAEGRRAEAWECRKVGDLCVPVPPGDLESFEVRGLEARAKFEKAEVTYSVFPPGFVRELYAAELEAVGGRRGDRELPEEGALFRSIVETTPGLFRFGWSSAERSEYAARLTAKMRLLRDWPTKRLDAYERAEPRAVAILAEYASGETTVIALVPGGTLFANVSGEAPASWKASPALWIPGEAAGR